MKIPFISKIALIDKKINLLVCSKICLNFKTKHDIVLPDSSYGEWLFYEKGMPKFHFYAFEKSGKLNEIALFAKEQNLQIPTLILNILSMKGFDSLDLDIEDNLSYETDSQIKEFQLLEIKYIT